MRVMCAPKDVLVQQPEAERKCHKAPQNNEYTKQAGLQTSGNQVNFICSPTRSRKPLRLSNWLACTWGQSLAWLHERRESR